jgi:hypothetical protein
VAALAEATARAGGEAELLGGLGALGDDVHAETGGERGDRPHHGLAGRVARHAAQERAVDLEHLDGQLARPRERECSVPKSSSGSSTPSRCRPSITSRVRSDACIGVSPRDRFILHAEDAGLITRICAAPPGAGVTDRRTG